VSGDGAQTFRTSPAAYDGHIGRYGPSSLRASGGRRGDRVLDVGCGTGLLTAELAAVAGGDHVAAIDPSEPFVDACRRRVPAADVRVAAAESLPFPDGGFDAVLSQLVVNFMTDPHGGVGEMRGVGRRQAALSRAAPNRAPGKQQTGSRTEGDL
jgi:ubiquinone/menaquinone biosynthesis C-methylase UbiE